MKIDSKYFDSIRIGSKKKKMDVSSDVPKCQWDDCEKPGPCRAPMGRLHEGKYLNFCMEHVREYNKNFNYFLGLSQSDIARFQKDSIIGHRPTWPSGFAGARKNEASKDFSRLPSGSAQYQNKLKNILGIINSDAIKGQPQIRKLKPLEEKAFKTLGIPISATSKEIKIKYKKLVKQYHPDTNGGDRSSEKQFANVLDAYKILKKSGLI